MPVTRSNGDAVALVFCCFEPEDFVLDQVRAASAAASSVVVVDDGSSSLAPGFYTPVAALPGVTVILSDENRGIAHALNVGIAALAGTAARWVMPFDQDTEFDSELISSLVDAAAALEAREPPVGAIAAGMVGDMTYGRFAGAEPAQVAEVIQSGTLFSMDALAKIGPADESLVIDGVDTDLCLRLRREGYGVFVLPQLAVRHRVGSGGSIRVGGRRISVTDHPAGRRYYMTRNRLRLAARYWRTEPRWALISLRRLFVGNVLAVTIEHDRRAKAAAILRGTVDAARGRSGKRPERAGRRA